MHMAYRNFKGIVALKSLSHDKGLRPRTLSCNKVQDEDTQIKRVSCRGFAN